MTRAGSHAELHALGTEGEALAAFLRGLDDAGWAAPTRCPPMDVRMIMVHLIEQMVVVAETCEQPALEVEREKDRLTWWDYDIATDQRETLDFVIDAAAAYPEGSLAVRWEQAHAAAVAAAGERLAGGDPCLRPGAAAIRLTDYLATRVLEVTIHAMDVLDAFGKPPAPTGPGMAVTHDILASLLGADPRALGFDDAGFALAATGRRPLEEAERERLGPIADRFPLLA